MIDFKQIIAKSIAKVVNIDEKELESYIEIPKDTNNGDYAFPCFRLAKELKKAPPMIANDIKEKIQIDEKIVKKVEVVGGYLNFYINQEKMVEEVLTDFGAQEEYGKSEMGKGKNIIVDLFPYITS